MSEKIDFEHQFFCYKIAQILYLQEKINQKNINMLNKNEKMHPKLQSNLLVTRD
jgi:hypothetical protein